MMEFEDSGDLVSRPLVLADVDATIRLLLGMYREVGRALLNPDKAKAEIIDTITRHVAYGVFHRDLLVASVGLIPLDGGLFYSDAPWFIDKWCYVQPEYRPKVLDATVFKMLLHEVRFLCNVSGRAVIIRIFNEKRLRVTDGIDRIAREFCYYPAGSVIEIRPQKKAPSP